MAPSSGQSIFFPLLCLINFSFTSAKSQSATCDSGWNAKSIDTVTNFGQIYFCCPTEYADTVTWTDVIGPLCCDKPSDGQIDCNSAFAQVAANGNGTSGLGDCPDENMRRGVIADQKGDVRIPFCSTKGLGTGLKAPLGSAVLGMMLVVAGFDMFV